MCYSNSISCHVCYLVIIEIKFMLKLLVNTSPVGDNYCLVLEQDLLTHLWTNNTFKMFFKSSMFYWFTRTCTRHVRGGGGGGDVDGGGDGDDGGDDGGDGDGQVMIMMVMMVMMS